MIGDFVEVNEDLSASPLWNPDLAPTPLAYRYALLSSSGLPALTPSNPRTKVLREVWARLPGWLARPLSDRLSRYLP